jgi:hypothetical protein
MLKSKRIIYRTATRKLPRGKWAYSKKFKEFNSDSWSDFQRFLEKEYGNNAEVQESTTSTPTRTSSTTLPPDRRYYIKPDPAVKPNTAIEVLAWYQEDDPLHLVTVHILTPAPDAVAAGNAVYDRLQDMDMDEAKWGFSVVSANGQALSGLISGETEQMGALMEYSTNVKY